MRSRHAVLSIIFALGLAGAAMAAADYDEGLAAFNRRDYKEAFDIWTPLAAQGNTRAQSGIAYLLDHGLGVARDKEEAARWYRTAAEHGFSLAQFFLGSKYAAGSGVVQDNILAYKWLKLAADQGDPAASHDLVNLRNRMAASDVRQAELLAQQFRPTGSAAITAQPTEYRPRYQSATTAVATGGTDGLPREQVRRIQELLRLVGYDPGPADGMAGRRTAAAIRAFERSAGLKVTGEPSMTLLVALEERAKSVRTAASRQPTLTDRTGLAIGASEDASGAFQATAPQFIDRSTMSLSDLQQRMQSENSGVPVIVSAPVGSATGALPTEPGKSMSVRGTIYPIREGLAWLTSDNADLPNGRRGIAVFSGDSWPCTGCVMDVQGRLTQRVLTYKGTPMGYLTGIEITGSPSR